MMNYGKTIDILLATFNGAGHLPELLDSLINQTVTEWQLLVRDDGSTDSTLELLKEYGARFPGRFKIIADAGERLGPCQNFSRLLEFSSGDYVMFCDQDDVWLPEKIQRSIDKMHEMERCYGLAVPLLVHTDLSITDAFLKVIHPSLWRYQRMKPDYGGDLNRLLIQNYTTGCAMLFNRAARNAALPVPREAVMHDWWLALVTAAFGHVGYLDESLVLYRQHGMNELGARGITWSELVHRFRNGDSVRTNIARLQLQAAAFLNCYLARLTTRQKEMLDVYARLASFNGFMRRWYMVRFRLLYSSTLLNIGRLLLG